MHPGFGASEKGSKTGLLKNADCQHFVGKVGLLEGSGNRAIENHHLAIENYFSMFSTSMHQCVYGERERERVERTTSGKATYRTHEMSSFASITGLWV